MNAPTSDSNNVNKVHSGARAVNVKFGVNNGNFASDTRGSIKMQNSSFLANLHGLPSSVHLLTVKDNNDGRLLVRLAHIFQVCLYLPRIAWLCVA